LGSGSCPEAVLDLVADKWAMSENPQHRLRNLIPISSPLNHLSLPQLAEDAGQPPSTGSLRRQPLPHSSGGLQRVPPPSLPRERTPQARRGAARSPRRCRRAAPPGRRPPQVRRPPPARCCRRSAAAAIPPSKISLPLLPEGVE